MSQTWRCLCSLNSSCLIFSFLGNTKRKENQNLVWMHFTSHWRRVVCVLWMLLVLFCVSGCVCSMEATRTVKIWQGLRISISVQVQCYIFLLRSHFVKKLKTWESDQWLLTREVTNDSIHCWLVCVFLRWLKEWEWER